jgi:hypothetical protein
MRGLRGNALKPKIFAQITDKPSLVLAQVIKDLLHGDRFKQIPATQGIGKEPIN